MKSENERKASRQDPFTQDAYPFDQYLNPRAAPQVVSSIASPYFDSLKHPSTSKMEGSTVGVGDGHR